MHVSLDEATIIPEMINLTPAKLSNRCGADNVRYPKDTIVIDDRGYFDFGEFATRIDDKNHFVTRMKSNTMYELIGEFNLPVEKNQHILKDERIYLTETVAEKAGIDQVEMWRVAIYREKAQKSLTFG